MNKESNYQIRAAKFEDVPALGELLRNSFLTTMSPIVPEAANIAFSQMKEPERFAKSCWQDFQVIASPGKIIGMLYVIKDKIESIHLQPMEKRKGFGSLLLHEGETQILHQGYDLAKLDVLTHNDNAIAFYLSQGWHIDHQFTGYEVGEVPVPMHQMQKKLREL